MQYADDTDLLSTSHTHLEEVMDVLDRELLLYHFQATKTRHRGYKFIMTE